MEAASHTLPDLFGQLGLPNTESDIKRFVAQHAPLDCAVRLSEASFWSQAQSTFLREEINEDADWAEVVDQLNLMLRR